MIEIKSKEQILVLHKNPDLDAIVGGWQMVRFGENKFPKISKAKFLFWGGGPNPIPVGEGIIQIDIGGGKYDHHPANEFPNECAATKVADDLGIREDPALTEILEYTKKYDLQGTRSPLDLADFIQCCNKKYQGNPERVLEVTFEILDALYSYYGSKEKPIQEDRNRLAEFIESWLKDKDRFVAQQIIKFATGLRNGNRQPFDLTVIFCAMERKYPEKTETRTKELLDAKYFTQQMFFEAREELKKAKITSILRGKQILNIVTVKSGNSEVARIARHLKYGCNAAIVIQQNSNGRTLIFTNNRFYLADDLQNIVAMIRLEEQLQRKSEKLTLNFRKLRQPGYIQYVENWYFQKENNRGGGKLLNGSSTSPDIEPTKIPLQRIQEIVVTALRFGKYFKWERWDTEAIALQQRA